MPAKMHTNKKASRPSPPVPGSAAIPAHISACAARIGLEVSSLLDWKHYPDGRVVLVAANGMKFCLREEEHEHIDQPVERTAPAAG